MKKVEKAIDRIQIEFEIEIHYIFFSLLPNQVSQNP